MPANSIILANFDLTWGHRLRRWTNVKSALSQFILFAEVADEKWGGGGDD